MITLIHNSLWWRFKFLLFIALDIVTHLGYIGLTTLAIIPLICNQFVSPLSKIGLFLVFKRLKIYAKLTLALLCWVSTPCFNFEPIWAFLDENWCIVFSIHNFCFFCIIFIFNLNPRQSFDVLELVRFRKLVLYNLCLWDGNSQNMSGKF